MNALSCRFKNRLRPDSATARARAHARGVTVIELMIALGIAAILGAVAIPELGHVHRAAARRAALNDFMHAIFLARSKAIMTNGVVSICRTKDRVTCGDRSGKWEDGWMVFVNRDGDQPAERDADEEIIELHAGWTGGEITSNRVAFSFRPTAQIDVNGTLVFCDLHGKASDARAIIISHTGRPRIATRDASDHALSCP